VWKHRAEFTLFLLGLALGYFARSLGGECRFVVLFLLALLWLVLAMLIYKTWYGKPPPKRPDDL
jgi:hypothetical protein